MDRLFKILLLGNPSEETRTRLINWFERSFRQDYKSTVGVGIYKHTTVHENQEIVFSIWEPNISLLKESILEMMFEGSSGALYFIDDTQEEPFKDFGTWLPIIQYEVGTDLAGYAFILVRIPSGDNIPYRNKHLLSEKNKWFDNYYELTFTQKEHIEIIIQKMNKLVLANNSKDTPFRLRLQGKEHLRCGRYDKAIENFENALKLNPSYDIINEELKRAKKLNQKKK